MPGYARQMLPADEMPDDNVLLAGVAIDFPRLKPDTAVACPVSFAEVLAYLAREVPQGGALSERDLTFLRTARVADCDYWVWSFREPGALGAEAFATVCLSEGGDVCLGYEANTYDLSPEQFLLGDYHGVS